VGSDPSSEIIVSTIDSSLHVSSGGKSSGAEIHPLLKGLLSSPLKGRSVTGYPSHSLTELPIELERSINSITRRSLDKQVFKGFYKGLSIPYLTKGDFHSLNPQLCKDFLNRISFI